MRQEAALPTEFEDLTSQVFYVRQTKRAGEIEYHSSCPQCGGAIHPDGEWPDRFTMWVKSHATGGPLGWCRVCGFKWWPGKGEVQLTREMKEKWAEERRRKAEEDRAEAERKYQRILRLLEAEKPWILYNENLGEDGSEIRMLWEKRGISYTWQQIWQLGYVPDFRVYVPKTDEEFYTPTLSIPVFQPGSDIPVNIVHRLLRPQKNAGKYRQQFSGLLPVPWMSDPELGWDAERFLVVEGQIKAAVTYITLDSYKTQVLGVQGKNAFDLIAPKLCGRNVYVLMDPDAQDIAVPFARSIEARNVSLPGKIDDQILNGWLDKWNIERMLRSASKVN